MASLKMPKVVLFSSAALSLLLTACGGGMGTNASLPATNPARTTQSATHNNDLCFSGAGGSCRRISGTSVRLSIPAGTPLGAYAGVYIQNGNSVDAATVGQITSLSYNYGGDPLVGGSPRINIPVDVSGSFAGYVFVGANTCNNGAGLVDVINNPTCGIEGQSGGYYYGWASYVASNPTATIEARSAPYVIIDEPGTYTISNFTFRTSTPKR